MPIRTHLLAAVLCATVAAPAVLGAQAPWTFRTRAVATGSSDRSEPAGYTVYTAFAWEAAVARSLGGPLALELSVRTESHEVDLAAPPGPDLRLGSLEWMPVNLTVEYRLPLRGALRPYVGAGVNLTVTWEKSGLLDSDGFSPSIGPAVEIGTDVGLTAAVDLNVTLRWHTMRTDRSVNGTTVATLRVDPASLGVGLGFRL